MTVGMLIKGMLIGLVFGVPAGAIGVLTIQRTLEKGFWAGLLTGLGSSAADLLYSLAGIWGITFISAFLTAYQHTLQRLGGIAILILGSLIIRKKALPTNSAPQEGSQVFNFLSSFVIAALNPATLLSFMVAFASFGITGPFSAGEAGSLTLGILLGTLCWWVLLSGLAAHFRSRITNRIYQWLNRLLGCFLILFGGAMLVRSILT